MNKKSKQKSNIVVFPKLKERLFEKGMQQLNEKKLKEALNTFVELENYFPEMDEDPDFQVAWIIALTEYGQLLPAKERCRRLLSLDLGDYYNNLELYVSILNLLGDYEEAVILLEMVLQETKIPHTKAEHIFQLLEMNRACLQKQDTMYEEQDHSAFETFQALISSNNIQDQWSIIKQLEATDIRIILQEIKEFLHDSNGHPIIKTMLIHLLIEQSISETIIVKKFSKNLKMNPSDELMLFENEFYIIGSNTLNDILGSENPTLFEAARHLWEMVLFILYPFLPDKNKASVWAAAIYKIGYEYFGIDIEMDDLTESFNVQVEDIIEIIQEIKALEQKWLATL